jgi:hypothetical protein
MFDALKGADPGELLDNWSDGRIKLFLTHRLLTFRRENPELFRYGSYRPLGLTGEFADCCIALRAGMGRPVDRCSRSAVEFAGRISTDRRCVARHGGALAPRICAGKRASHQEEDCRRGVAESRSSFRASCRSR